MTKRCEVCKFDLQDNYSYQGHLQGKKHLKNVERSKFLQSLIQRSIFVSRIPSYISTENLIKFFSHFDQILKYRFGPNYAIIEFKTVKAVQYLLSQVIYFNRTKLNISPRNINVNKVPIINEKNNVMQQSVNDSENLIYDNIKSIFEVKLTFNEQLKAFLNKIAISNFEIETRYELTCKAINKIFLNIFPNCKIHRFGSTISGLGFKNCDLDIFLEIVSKKDYGSIECKVSTTEIFSKVKSILYSKSTLFSNVFPIPRAKTPIIKFTYIPTKISCDISFKNDLAIHNSELIKFYLSLNSQLRPTMMILKYWIWNYECREPNKITKYALSILFIFYLQQSYANLVPPVIQLKKNCVPEIVDGWQVNFDKTLINYQQDEKKKKYISIPELLYGFFHFYANYNFKSNVICCVDGISHNKLLLNDPETIPESMDRYKVYLKTRENPITFSTDKPMCVQDPNELNHNVTGNVCVRYLDHFQKYCATASEICLNAAKNSHKELLPSIFSIIIQERKKEKYKFYFYVNNLNQLRHLKDISFHFDNKNNKLFMKENWFTLVVDLIKKFFESVLKFEVQYINEQEEKKQQKIEVQSDVHSKDQNKIKMHCTGNYCLWRGRKSRFNYIFDPRKTLLEKEIEVTNDIFEELNMKDEHAKLNIDFECHILMKWRDKSYLVLLLFENNCKKQIFVELVDYIKKKMPYVLNKTLQHMQQ